MNQRIEKQRFEWRDECSFTTMYFDFVIEQFSLFNKDNNWTSKSLNILHNCFWLAEAIRYMQKYTEQDLSCQATPVHVTFN